MLRNQVTKCTGEEFVGKNKRDQVAGREGEGEKKKGYFMKKKI